MVPRNKIIEKLQTEGNKIIELFSSFSSEDWKILIYSDKMEWEVKDILSHFISAERSFLSLFDNIRVNNKGTPEGFSIDEFNNSQVLKMKEIQNKELIELFKETRTNTINWFMTIPETDLDKIGKHPGMGEVKIIDMIKMIYLHNQMHLRELILAVKDHKG